MRFLPSRTTILAPILPIFIFLTLLAVVPARVWAQHWSLEDTLVITDVNIVDVRTGEVRAAEVRAADVRGETLRRFSPIRIR